jgi:isoquinoline 1-oxidoreductase subunit alpha
MAIAITVNGQVKQVQASGDTPLLWVIRDELGLTGTKYGCGIAQCGACTVLIDGQAMRSCVTPVETVGTGKVTTIEGLSVGGDHPVQKAWQSLDVVQCGFCQSGQILAAVALLAEKPKPNDADIDAAMEGNICRCATYARIKVAIKQAAGVAPTTQKG